MNQESKYVYDCIEASMQLNPDKTLFNFKGGSTGISAENREVFDNNKKKENHHKKREKR